MECLITYLTTMLKIPTQDNRFIQSGKSDLLGNIHYTKNINFNESGYAKLSSRSVAIQSEKDDSNFDLPISYGRSSIGWNVVTADKPWYFGLINSAFASQQDADTAAPQMSFDSWGTWWQNKWHAIKDNLTTASLFSKTTTVWTERFTSITSGYAHPIEVLRNSNTLCIGNGNAVIQINTSWVVSTLSQLSIPADFEVIDIKYSNGKLGVATKLSDSASSQNQEAYFFVWDGTSAQANQGFPVGSDAILGITAYKSSWVILTRKGELLYYTGGGFQILETLPYYYVSAILGDSANRVAHGNTLQVEGDLIYINASNGFNALGKRKEVYLENYPSGILCYDPKVGIYHRYSPSISLLKQGTVTSGNVNTTTGIFTVSSAVVPVTGGQVMLIFDQATPIGGLKAGIAYYVIRVTTSSFKIATTRQNAIDGVYLTPTSTGVASNTFVFLDLKDYGASLCQNRVGGIGVVESNTQLYDHLLFGGEYEDYATTNNYATTCMTVPQFPNKGYLVSSKFISQNIQDEYPKLYIKYRPLKTSDSIVIKYKDKDVLGLPVTTPQIPNLYICTWTSDTTFTTQADIEDAYTFMQTSGNELECEIINGAGAGSMPQVTSIAYDSGTTTYTVTLADSVEGAANTYYCNVILNNWKLLKTINNNSSITSSDTEGYMELPINTKSKWIKVKTILNGVETTLEELQLINSNFKPSE